MFLINFNACSNICRPMYIDSTNADVPGGDLTVASLLRANVEPLLKVSNTTARCFIVCSRLEEY